MGNREVWELVRKKNPIIKRNAVVDYAGRAYRVANVTSGLGVRLRDEILAHPADVQPHAEVDERDKWLLEARAMALQEYAEGTAPAEMKEYPVHQFIERTMYVRVTARSGDESTTYVCPCWDKDEIEDALRLDGCDTFIVTDFDESFIYEKCRIWWEGVKRFYKSIGHGSAIAVRLLPAGTGLDVD